MQAAEFDVRLSRRPIERYECPLGAALIALALSILIGERKRTRQRIHSFVPAKIAASAAALMICLGQFAFAAAPGLDAYREGKFNDAFSQFQQTLKMHPQSRAEDKLQFDSGAAAYKLKDYGKALESFSQALLSPDTGLQSRSHYNLGNTLYERGDTQKSDDKKLSDWTNALNHYEQTLKFEPGNKEAKENYDYVKKKIEELKNKKQQKEQQQQPSPSPSPQQKNKQDQQNQQSQQDQQQQQQQQQQQGQGQQQQKDQQQQSQKKSGSGNDQKEEKKNEQSQAKNEPQQPKQQHGDQPSPSPSPGEKKQDQEQSGEGEQPSATPGPGSPTPATTPGEHGDEMPSPSPGNGEGSEKNATPSATPAESPQKKLAGELKGADEDKSQKPPDKNEQIGEAEAEKEGQMSERQAEALLQSLKDEEARVRLDERKAARHVYNDW
jgi:Ca-activated chloride channel family protein